MNGPHAPWPDTAAAIAALRARGAARAEPVRWRLIQAMARRAAAHGGPTRQLLEARLAQLLADCAQRLDRAPAPAAAPRMPRPGALAPLLTALGGDPAAAPCAADRAPAELKTVRLHRSTWSRLSVDQRLTQSMATVPDQAGPLNTQRLLHEALTLMREASPDYLHRVMTQVEALMWLAQALPVGSVAKKEPARTPR